MWWPPSQWGKSNPEEFPDPKDAVELAFEDLCQREGLTDYVIYHIHGIGIRSAQAFSQTTGAWIAELRMGIDGKIVRVRHEAYPDTGEET